MNFSHGLSWMKLFTMFFIIVSVLPLNANAQEIYENYIGIRSLGMGGVNAAIVNDETALISNPAGLGKLRDYFVTVVDPEIEWGVNTGTVYGTNSTAFLDPQTTLDLLKAKLGSRVHQKLALFPSFVVSNFGFGVYANYITDATVNEADTEYELFHRNDVALVGGFNLRIWDGRIKFGVNARITNRVEIDRRDTNFIDPSSTGLTVAGLASEGLGVGLDAGLILAAPWAWLPTLAFVVHDFGGTKYDLGSGLLHSTSTRPATQEQKVDAAIGLFPIAGKKTRVAFSVEYKDALSETETDLNRRLHYGIEFNFSDALFLRAGSNQGYWTAGAELAMYNYQLQLAAYGEEIGTVAVPEEDRRYLFKFAYRF